jgi:hypothetical protein
VSKPVPNESGPGQPSAPPVTSTLEAPAENADEASPVNSPPQNDDYDEAGPSNQVPIGPGDSAASPAPEAAFASPYPVVTTVKPAATPAASTKSSAICSAGLPGCECVVPAVLARPYCRICSGCFTHACACIAPPSGGYSRSRRQRTTLSCGLKSWSCAVIADRENLQSLLDCLCHCSSSELSYNRTHVLLGGLAVIGCISVVCTGLLPSPSVHVVFLCCALLVCICTLMQLWVQFCINLCVVLFACLRLLVGGGP